MKELRDKLRNALKGLDRKTINLNLLESFEYFYYSKGCWKKKEGKKKYDGGVREIKKYLFYNYILNLENIIRKMNKMILVIFGEYKYE